MWRKIFHGLLSFDEPHYDYHRIFFLQQIRNISNSASQSILEHAVINFIKGRAKVDARYWSTLRSVPNLLAVKFSEQGHLADKVAKLKKFSTIELPNDHSYEFKGAFAKILFLFLLKAAPQKLLSFSELPLLLRSLIILLR